MSASELVRGRRVVLAAGKHPLPTVADLVAGEPVRGNWWSHPKAHAIFAALQVLDHDPEVRLCRLVDGRVTFVHSSLWPAVIRVAGDGPRARAALRRVPATARRLFDEAESAGVRGLRTDAVSEALRVSRRHLERALLVQTDEVHTESGKHAAVLRAWAHVGSERERRAAASLSMEEATDAIVEALIGSAGATSLKEVRRWVSLGADDVGFAVKRLVREGRVTEKGASVSRVAGTG